MVAVGEARKEASNSALLVFTKLNNSQKLYPGGAGSLMIDGQRRVVAMLLRNDVEAEQTFGAPIEDIRSTFPRAF